MTSEKKVLKPLILDLGCGKNKHKGAVGVDNVGVEGVDVVWDLTQFPYPWGNNSVDKIFCYQVLEHFNSEVYIKILKEMHRMLKIGGIINVRVPHVNCVGAFQDPTHKSFFVMRTMDHFDIVHDTAYYKAFDFHLTIINKSVSINMFNRWQNKNLFQKIIDRGLTSFFNLILGWSVDICEIMLKNMPVYHIDINWTLRKQV